MLRRFLSPKGDGFSFILIEPQRGDDGVAGFAWGLAHRGKPANTSSQDAVVITNERVFSVLVQSSVHFLVFVLAGAENLALQLVLRRRRKTTIAWDAAIVQSSKMYRL